MKYAILIVATLIAVSGCGDRIQSDVLSTIVEQRKDKLTEYNITEFEIDTCSVRTMTGCGNAISGNFGEVTVGYLPFRDAALDGVEANLVNGKWVVTAPSDIKSFNAGRVASDFAGFLDSYISIMDKRSANRESWEAPAK
jgi:hypothetical protein